MRDVSRSADVDGEQQLSHDEQVMRDMRNIDIGMDDGFVKFLVFKLFNRRPPFTRSVVIRGDTHSATLPDVFDSAEKELVRTGFYFQAVAGGALIIFREQKMIGIYVNYKRGYPKIDTAMTMELFSEAFPDFKVGVIYTAPDESAILRRLEQGDKITIHALSSSGDDTDFGSPQIAFDRTHEGRSSFPSDTVYGGVGHHDGGYDSDSYKQRQLLTSSSSSATKRYLQTSGPSDYKTPTHPDTGSPTSSFGSPPPAGSAKQTQSSSLMSPPAHSLGLPSSTASSDWAPSSSASDSDALSVTDSSKKLEQQIHQLEEQRRQLELQIQQQQLQQKQQQQRQLREEQFPGSQQAMQFQSQPSSLQPQAPQSFQQNLSSDSEAITPPMMSLDPNMLDPNSMDSMSSASSTVPSFPGDRQQPQQTSETRAFSPAGLLSARGSTPAVFDEKKHSLAAQQEAFDKKIEAMRAEMRAQADKASSVGSDSDRGSQSWLPSVASSKSNKDSEDSDKSSAGSRDMGKLFQKKRR
ncbi:uncharacterized protein LOC142339888 isoform X2 [Convolutriloba macropyga]|uniref:uncharacterized protein LOC142339888 isoform X2 n=1 Tax=Convolutriloba macropyga TaxID=536237 RepID=UPI003F52149C